MFNILSMKSHSTPGTSGLYGLLSQAKFLADEMANGIPYAPGEKRPAEGYTEVYSQDAELDLREKLTKVGLGNLAVLLKFDTYKEKPEQSGLIYAPIRSHVIRAKMWLLKKALLLPDGQLPRSITEGKSEEDFQNTDLSPEREYLNFILQHLNPAADGEMNYHLPRILVTDMLSQNLPFRLPEVLHDLNPSELVASCYPGLPDMVNEIVGDDELRQGVLLAMTQASRCESFPKPPHTWDNAVKYTVHGGFHEVSHFLAGYIPQEAEDKLLNLFLGLKDSQLYYKNMVKALSGVRRYREERRLPASTDTSLDVLRVFANEMVCDYLAMYLMEHTEEQHIYASVYGVRIPQGLRQGLDSLFRGLVDLDRNRLMLLYSDQTEAKSAFIHAQETIGSLGTNHPMSFRMYKPLPNAGC